MSGFRHVAEGITCFNVATGMRGGWAVSRWGRTRAWRIFKDRAEAVREGKRLAKREGSILYVHHVDGCVSARYCYLHNGKATNE